MPKANNKRKYFHLLTDEDFRQALEDKKSYDDFMQPDWCSYHDALSSFKFGCWKLTGRGVRCEADCTECGCFSPQDKSETINKQL